MVLRRLSQTLRISLALMVATFSSGLLQPVVVLATPGNGGGNGGNIDCPTGTTLLAKYEFRSGTYVAESGGTNVSVTGNAKSGSFTVLKANTTVSAVVVKGSNTAKTTPYSNVTTGSFNNVGLNNGGGNAPDISNVKICGKTTTPTPVNTPVTAGAVTYNDVCGIANDTYTVPTTANVTYSVAAGTYPGSGAVSVTASANTGYALTAPYSFNYTFTNEACPVVPTVINTPTVPTVDPCGSDNIRFGTIPTSTQYTLDSQTSTSLTFKATAGHTFAGGHLYAVVNLPADSNTPCPVVLTTIAVPNVPITDPCGPRNIAFGTIPTSTQYTLDSQTSTSLTFKATPGHAFAGGHLYAVVTLPADSNTPCEVVPTPLADIDVKAVCVEGGVKVTLVNTGDASGTANVNGTNYTVSAGATKEVVLGYDLGTPFKTAVTVTVGEATFAALINCAPGQGAGNPTTPPPTPGQTLGTSTTSTPVVTAVQNAVLPAVLPSTGGVDSPFMILVASVLAFGATYFLQGKRLLGRREAVQA